MPQLGALRTAVQRRVSAHNADSLLTSAVLDDFINIAVTQVTLEEDWPWLFNTVTFPTVVGQTSYSTPSDWRKTHTLTDLLAGDHLEQRTMQELDTSIYPGVPRIYALYQDKLQLKPTPQDVRTIQHRYLRVENALTSDSSSLLMPDGLGMEEGIIEYAAYLALRFQREDVRAEQARAAYNAWLKRAQNNYLRTREPLRLRVRPGSML